MLLLHFLHLIIKSIHLFIFMYPATWRHLISFCFSILLIWPRVMFSIVIGCLTLSTFPERSRSLWWYPIWVIAELSLTLLLSVVLNIFLIQAHHHLLHAEDLSSIFAALIFWINAITVAILRFTTDVLWAWLYRSIYGVFWILLLLLPSQWTIGVPTTLLHL